MVRAKVLQVKQLIDQDIDPSIRHKQKKSVTLNNTLASISDEWMKTRAKWQAIFCVDQEKPLFCASCPFNK